MPETDNKFGPYIEFKAKNRVGIITFNKIERSNAFDIPQLRNFKKALNYCQNNKRIRVIILTGKGKSFTTGMDIKSIDPERSREYPDAKVLEETFSEIVRILLYGKPVIAAINGRTIGGGVEMAIFCDYRVGLNEGYYQMAEILINVFPGTGCITMMVRTIGLLWTKKLLMWGDKLSPQQALDIGIIDELVETREDLMDIAIKRARFLVSRNQAVINAIRLCANHIWEKSYDEAYKMEHYSSNWFEHERGKFIDDFKRDFNLL